MQKTFDFVIVGQGLAGTLLAYFLKKAGKTVLIFDNNHRHAASMVAAGIINPITGKNFVKSWRIDEFLPFAQKTYTEIEAELSLCFMHKKNLIRAFDSVLDENNWLAKSGDPDINKYILDPADVTGLSDIIKTGVRCGEICGSLQINLKEMLGAFKEKWVQEEIYVEDRFDYEQLIETYAGFKYQDFTFKEIVFCEGSMGAKNPFFPNSGLAPSKGEVLIVKIDGPPLKKMYKDGIFIVHVQEDLYWIGSGYEWNAQDDLPTEKGRKLIEQALTKILSVPFEVIDHKAAIRPTMQKRRPVLIQHSDIRGIYFFNGLGTKGSSVGPFAAHQFASYLLYHNEKDLYLH